MDEKQGKKKFPSYFENFEMPEWAREQELEVYRACATGKVDEKSFLNSFEENGFQVSLGGEEDDPQEYSLSSYTKFKDVKRFMTMDSRFGVPFKIAKGITKPVHGICLETKEWKRNLGIKYRGSHVDWWLYENAEPWKEFEEVILDEDREYI
ncbi:hypothetical protein [uncultured Clostridium sp.]|uniref:hypothetical protein n=1 Tax=uncultured Clostridium sp. TaxID=59620 RepID=UPI0025E7E7F8|nr:hypothetical protein [uncultured Clostridium sp.]